jgi:hypothetical protein
LSGGVPQYKLASPTPDWPAFLLPVSGKPLGRGEQYPDEMRYRSFLKNPKKCKKFCKKAQKSKIK